MNKSADYSLKKQNILISSIEGFWEDDSWQLYYSPVDSSQIRISKQYCINFFIQNERLKNELKYACMKKFINNEWVMNSKRLVSIKRIIKWINVINLREKSFLLKKLKYWEKILIKFLKQEDILFRYPKRKLNADQEIIYTTQADNSVTTFRVIYKLLEKTYDTRTGFEKDIWDLRELGIKFDKSRYASKLNFSKIKQNWLKDAVKKVVKHQLSINSPSHCSAIIRVVNHFSDFLVKHHPDIISNDINRKIIIKFIDYINKKEFANSTQNTYLGNLRKVFRICRRNKLLDLTSEKLIYNSDLSGRPKNKSVKYIPSYVLSQLNKNLESLTPVIRRMVLIIQETGVRITELCNMPFDCLLKDYQGDFFLRYYQSKMRKEHTIPISLGIAGVINEQQDYLKDNDLVKYNLLFPQENGKPIKQIYFNRELNKLSYQKKIRDKNGNIFRFNSHQFRHTLGTSMINNGVPQHIVQKYLGHESPEMTNTYAKIQNKKMKEEFKKITNSKDNIDIYGKENKKIIDEDTEWLRKNILGQSLANGYCYLPVKAGSCPHANACLTCEYFRTDQSFLKEHKKHLERTKDIIKTAKENNWQRQLEMNRKVQNNLINIIATLEERGD